MRIIHRMNFQGMPKCGEKEGKVSTTGVLITCPKCIELTREPTKEEIEKRMSEVLGYTVKL
jgi:hypothetical protein